MPKTRPNLLIIMDDQHRYDYLGCAGADFVRTVGFNLTLDWGGTDKKSQSRSRKRCDNERIAGP